MNEEQTAPSSKPTFKAFAALTPDKGTVTIGTITITSGKADPARVLKEGKLITP